MAQQEQMLIDEMRHHMDTFLRIALKVSKFECVKTSRIACAVRCRLKKFCTCRWALEICDILLANKDCWIDVLNDNELRAQFWNSIAALQTQLLRTVVSANIERLVDEVSERHKRAVQNQVAKWPIRHLLAF